MRAYTLKYQFIEDGMPIGATTHFSVLSVMSQSAYDQCVADGYGRLLRADMRGCRLVAEDPRNTKNEAVLIMVHNEKFRVTKGGRRKSVPTVSGNCFFVIMLSPGQEIEFEGGSSIIFEPSAIRPRYISWQQRIVSRVRSAKQLKGQHVLCMRLIQAYDVHGLPDETYDYSELSQVLVPGICVENDTMLGCGVEFGSVDDQDCIPVFGNLSNDDSLLTHAQLSLLGEKPTDKRVKLFGLTVCAPVEVPDAWLVIANGAMFRNPVMVSGSPHIVDIERKTGNHDPMEDIVIIIRKGDVLAYHVSGQKHSLGYVSYVLCIVNNKPCIMRYLEWRAVDIQLRPDYYKRIGRSHIGHWLQWPS